MEKSQTLSEIFHKFQTCLSDHYSNNEIRNIFYLTSEHLLNYSKIDIHLKGDEVLFSEIIKKFEKILTRLINWEPIQYITGRTDFYGLPFYVDCRVLIPRPETEELTAWVISDQAQNPISILDLGTGSGCIAVSLAKNIAGSVVSACDISIDSLAVAQLNALKNNATVSFFQFDLLNGADILPGKFQVMVSNPPYVRKIEKKYMRKNVLDYEPDIALFVPDYDALIYYRSLALLGRKYLVDGGALYLEINENLPHEIVNLLENAGFCSVETRHDLNGKARMIKGVK